MNYQETKYGFDYGAGKVRIHDQKTGKELLPKNTKITHGMEGAKNERNGVDVNRLVSFEDWESGKVKLTDEYFERRTVGDRFFFGSSTGSNRIIETVVYVGRETGTVLGEWFAEVMEPSLS